MGITGAALRTSQIEDTSACRFAPAAVPAHSRPSDVSWPAVRPALKRSLDVTLALTALMITLPLLMVIAAAVKLDSRGPVFYRVRRVGYRGQTLLMLKFRKMHSEAVGVPLTIEDDPRLTRVGAFLTRSRLDELPQFWDVLCGRMSIVGPRPEDPSFVALHQDDYRHILAVRPGITGLAQLAYAEEQRILTKHDLVGDYLARILPQKVGLDILYSETYGVRRDLAILRWTVVAMLLRRPVAVHRVTGAMNIRRRRASEPAEASAAALSAAQAA